MRGFRRGLCLGSRGLAAHTGSLLTSRVWTASLSRVLRGLQCRQHIHCQQTRRWWRPSLQDIEPSSNCYCGMIRHSGNRVAHVCFTNTDAPYTRVSVKHMCVTAELAPHCIVIHCWRAGRLWRHPRLTKHHSRQRMLDVRKEMTKVMQGTALAGI